MQSIRITSRPNRKKKEVETVQTIQMNITKLIPKEKT